jgi:hypothetical protein
MKKQESVVAIYHRHADAEKAVKDLQHAASI